MKTNRFKIASRMILVIFFTVLILCSMVIICYGCATGRMEIAEKPIDTAEECINRILSPQLHDPEPYLYNPEIINKCDYEKGVWHCTCNGMPYLMTELGRIYKGVNYEEKAN